MPEVSVSALRDERHLAELLATSDCVVIDSAADTASFVARQSRGMVAVDIADQASSLDPELCRRADVFFCRSEQARDSLVRELETNGQGPANGDLNKRFLVLPDEAEKQKNVLRSVLWEPWRWQRNVDHVAQVEVPEDLRLLLQMWREHYHRNPLRVRVARAVWRRLPTRVQRGIFRLVK
jgi:hypothetical protein